MGSSTSAYVKPGNSSQGDNELTNAQICNNIENLFKSPNTSRDLNTVNSLRIEHSGNMLETSPVEVDTIVNGMKGGNRSRLSIIPERKRYKDADTSSTKTSKQTNNNNLTSDDIRFVKNIVYQKEETNLSGGNNDQNSIFAPVNSQENPDANFGAFSATSVDFMSEK